MNKQLIPAALALCLSACATSGPEETTPAAEMAMAPVAAEKSQAAAEVESAGEAAEGEVKTASTTEDKIVCRKERVTGSRFAKKVCRRASDIEERAESDKDALRQMRTIRSGSSNAVQGIRGN